MNENMRLWIDELRTTTLAQGKGRLRMFENGVRAYCCLGIACELHRLHSGNPGYWDGSSYVVDNTAERGVLPMPVAMWLGIEGIDANDPSINGHSLSTYNDGRSWELEPHTFVQIADLLESIQPGE